MQEFLCNKYLKSKTLALVSERASNSQVWMGFVTPWPDTPAVDPETPGKTVEVSLNPSLSLSTLTQLSLLSFLFLPELGSFPHCPSIDLHLRPPDRRFLPRASSSSRSPPFPKPVWSIPRLESASHGRPPLLTAWSSSSRVEPIVWPPSARTEHGISFTASFSTFFEFFPTLFHCWRTRNVMGAAAPRDMYVVFALLLGLHGDSGYKPGYSGLGTLRGKLRV